MIKLKRATKDLKVGDLIPSATTLPDIFPRLWKIVGLDKLLVPAMPNASFCVGKKIKLQSKGTNDSLWEIEIDSLDNDIHTIFVGEAKQIDTKSD